MSKWLRILVSLVLIAIVISFADWRAVWNVLRSVDLRWVAAALALAAIDRVLINARFDFLLRARGIKIGFGRLLRLQLLANFFGSFLPSSIGVDAIRIATLCRRGEPPALAMAATFMDRITLVIATLLFGSITIVLLAGTRIPGHITEFVFVMTAIGVFVCGLCLHPSVRRWVRLKLVPRIPLRFQEIVAKVADASLAYRHEHRALLQVAVTTLILLFVRILFAKALAAACGVNVPVADLLLVIPVLWIVVMLPITIGGIGVQDAGYVVLMSLIGISAPIAVSMSLLEHVVARLASLPGAFFLGDVSKTAVIESSAAMTNAALSEKRS